MSVDSSIKDKAAVCSECLDCSKALKNGFRFNEVWLEDYVSAEILELAIELTSQLSINDFISRRHGDVEVGKFCAYETLIKFKKTSLDLSEVEFSYYKECFKNAIISLEASKKLLQKKQFDRVIVYSPQYGINRMCTEAANLNQIPTYFVEGSSSIRERYSALRIWNWESFRLVNPALNYFSTSYEALDKNDRRRIEGHLDEIRRGRSYSVYSATSRSRMDVRQIHGISKQKKLLLAALSSYDEAYSALVVEGFPKEKFDSDVFINQFEWISALVNWVSKNSDFHLVIRLHPRDLPNRRETQLSEQSKMWQEILVDLPPNVSIDHPDDRIPLDSYFGAINLLTTGWSSTAIEAMVAGIPVVTYDSHLPSYPSSIHFTGRSQNDYFENLMTACSGQDSLKIREGALRWLSFSFNRGTVRVRGRVFDQSVVQNRTLLYYLVGGFTRFLPRLARRLDVMCWKLFPISVDGQKLNDLLKENLPSLYDLDSSSNK